MKPIQKTPLWAVIEDIQKAGQPVSRFEFTAVLHTKDKDLPLLKLISYDVERNYVRAYCDYNRVNVLIPLGVYVHDVYPYRTNLELTIYRRELEPVGGASRRGSGKVSQRFKCLFDQNNPAFTGKDLQRMDRERLNLQDVLTVSFQLLDRAIEPMRAVRISHGFAKVRYQDLLVGVFGKLSNDVKVDGRKAVDHIDIVPVQNKDLHSFVSVPAEGVALIDLPAYLNNSGKGLYNGGTGTYFQRYNDLKYWFVYPLFDPTRFQTARRKLVVYSVPQSAVSGTEKTYKEDGSVVYILATGGKRFSDSAENEYVSEGSGFRLTDAKAMITKPVEMTEAGPVANRQRLNYEVLVKRREDGFDLAPQSGKVISSNPYREYAKVMQREFSRFDIVWHAANPALIYPAMPVKFMYLEEDRLKEAVGVVLFAHVLIQAETQGLLSSAHTTTCMLTLFVSPQKS